jgi:Gluconate 2-dehydrogenase subunit 3
MSATVPGSAFTRREILRRLGIGAASTPVWVASLTALAEQQAHVHPPAMPSVPVANWVPKALDAHQNETVIALSELIIPETDTPGAKAVLVNRFVDAVLDDSDEADARMFRRGLAWIDARSTELFGVEFVKATPDQQTALLTIVSSERNKALEDQAGVEFFQAMKALTIVGYYTSEVGMREELHDDGQLFFAALEGCTHPEHGGTAPAVVPTTKKKKS